ncbi:hypothetical protein JYU34_000356 [Plutella xylostella]|uniref:Uncharacterized protein n=1 Tax=Plutella xylostella TaxID=51655 RepID=A0ABQ7R7G8_PLUXY|nr:hypothetical protein JYU34_000356 [Plutella xylostella]
MRAINRIYREYLGEEQATPNTPSLKIVVFKDCETLGAWSEDAKTQTKRIGGKPRDWGHDRRCASYLVQRLTHAI